jgi:hypothetical protein
VFGVLRLAFLSKSALVSLLVTSYVAVLGLVGLAGGFFADRFSTHISKAQSKQASVSRPDSRVERWLKTQTVSYAQNYTPADAVPVNSGPVGDAVPAARQLPRAVVLAAAMDQSEQGVAAEVSAAPEAVVEPVIARITAPVRQRLSSVPSCDAGSCKADASTKVAVKTKVAGKARTIKKSRQSTTQVATLKFKTKRVAATSVALLAPDNGKMALGLKPSLGSGKVVSRSPLMSRRNLYLADTPAEIIHRSLRGTS